jgi:hypothetical protein
MGIPGKKIHGASYSEAILPFIRDTAASIIPVFTVALLVFVEIVQVVLEMGSSG